MARAIDGNDFMRRLTLDTSKGHYGKFTDGSEVAFTSREIAAFVEQMPTLTPPNEWVSVEERLPPPNVRVLAYRPDEDDNSPYKYTNMWGWAVKESIRHRGITHWMPLPAPPESRPPEGEA